MRLRALRVGALGVLSLAIVQGQVDLATVTCVVTDAANAVAPDVKVTVRNAGFEGRKN